ncbi:hypothetical protein F2Q69_00048569 [Brassica cretica]|uniref:Uncharacterized protein n=1 Tax=Brassica cretica TaxID=69181 RepID=A0A8S9PWF4_BRACR|nr:hypothetical protein F2Q69_00048569 [Brassica cretica]
MARPRATLESLHGSLESRCGEVKLGFCGSMSREEAGHGRVSTKLSRGFRKQRPQHMEAAK